MKPDQIKKQPSIDQPMPIIPLLHDRYNHEIGFCQKIEVEENRSIQLDTLASSCVELLKKAVVLAEEDPLRLKCPLQLICYLLCSFV